jgi:hypothetical protein
VDQSLAVLMVILGSLLVTPIFFVNSVNDAAALLFVRGGKFLSTFDKPQRDAFAMLFRRLHHYGDLANEIFWGLWLLPFGLLVYKSRFLPRVLGAWLMIACFSHLACSFTGFLFPAYEDKVINYTQPVEWAEAAILLWLIIRCEGAAAGRSIRMICQSYAKNSAGEFTCIVQLGQNP